MIVIATNYFTKTDETEKTLKKEKKFKN